MDFSTTEEQGEIRALAQRILEDQLDEATMREVEAGDQRFHRPTWEALASANLLGIALPTEVGGSGFGVIEQGLVLEEVGRTVAPVPVLASIVLGAAPIATFGTPEQAKAWAAPAAEGRVMLTGALVEPGNPWPYPPRTTARRDGDGWRLEGTKTCIPAGLLADRILVPAATEDGTIVVFIVDPSAAGVTLTGQKVTNKEVEGHLVLKGVLVGDDAVLGSAEIGAEIVASMARHATLGMCAMQLGVVSRALEMTAEYAKTRVQFGRPIATFQAVGQRAADAYIDVEAVRLTTLQAAWRVDEGLPSEAEIEVAKFWAADAGHRVAHTAVHIHGGVGVDTDYPLHRYFVAAKHLEFGLGGATDQLLRLGARFAAGTALAGRAASAAD